MPHCLFAVRGTALVAVLLLVGVPAISGQVPRDTFDLAEAIAAARGTA